MPLVGSTPTQPITGSEAGASFNERVTTLRKSRDAQRLPLRRRNPEASFPLPLAYRPRTKSLDTAALAPTAPHTQLKNGSCVVPPPLISARPSPPGQKSVPRSISQNSTHLHIGSALCNFANTEQPVFGYAVAHLPTYEAGRSG